jgi:CubicO group peptidase (beta-lactamase class C family)
LGERQLVTLTSGGSGKELAVTEISDSSEGGWWQASDGKWYPPEAAAAPESAPLLGAVQSIWLLSGLRRRLLVLFAVLVFVPAACGSSDDNAAEATPAFDFRAAEPIVSDFIDTAGLNGAALTIVHRDHGVIYENFWGVYDENRISLLASSSKMVVAGVLLHLQDQGLLDINAPVADVAEWGAGNPDITPAQLLSNSSGLIGLFQDLFYGPYLCQWDYLQNLQDCAAQIMTTPDDDTEIIAPDTGFNYGGAQWQVAGAVAEAASGKTWAELIDEIYVQPCGLETFGFNSHVLQIEDAGSDHPPGFDSNPGQLAETANPNLEGGAYSNSRDYARLLLMHLQDGRCGDTQILTPESLATMHADRIAEAYDGDAYSPGTGYGMGWWVDRESGRISDGGAFGSTPWLDLADGYGVHLLTESNSGISGELAGLLYDVIDDAVAADIG